MPKVRAKKSRKSRKFQARIILFVLFIAIFFTVIIANTAFDWFSFCKNSSQDALEARPPIQGMRIYDINVPGSFFTFRNMGSSAVPGSSVRIFINDAEVQCQEGIEDVEPGETGVCTNPLVKVCKTIKVTSPAGNDMANCE